MKIFPVNRLCSGAKTVLLLFGFTALLAGCVKDDRDNCRLPGNYLLFYYPGNSNEDIFPSKIDRVEIFVYDQSETLVRRKLLTTAELRSFQGVKLDLPAGNYTAVGWANADRYSGYTQTENLSESRLYQSQELRGQEITQFDPLYFGRRLLQIHEGEYRTDTLTFTSAHINMEVHLAGFGGWFETRGPGDDPIQIANINNGYDFNMTLTSEKSLMYPEWTLEEDGRVIVSRFNLLRFSDRNDIMINILDSEGAERASVSLEQFLSENGISVEGINEITVPIYILFGNNGVTVSVEEWDSTIVTPVPSS